MYGYKPQCHKCGNTTRLLNTYFVCDYCWENGGKEKYEQKCKIKYKKKSDRRIKKDNR